MGEGRLAQEAASWAGVLQHVVPVGDIDQRSDPASAQLDRREVVGAERASNPHGERGGHHDADDHGGERRQEPASSPDPEGAQGDRSCDGALLEQERGDQEAREDEEEVDAEEATGEQEASGRVGAQDAEVEGQHRSDGEGAYAVEAREVSTPHCEVNLCRRVRRRRHRHLSQASGATRTQAGGEGPGRRPSGSAGSR